MMRAMDEMLNDSNLKEEEFQEIRTTVVKQAYQKIAGRTVIPVRKVDAGRQEYGWDAQSDIGDADVVAKATNFPGMTTDLVRSLVPILKHGVSFKIAREDLLSSRTNGETLDTRNAEAASRLTQFKENKTIIQGNTLHGINGLYTGAGKTEAGSDWGTGTNIEIDINDAFDEIGDKYVPDSLLVNNEQYLQMLKRNANTDKSYLSIIEEGYKLRVLVDKDITAGTGLLMQTGAEIAELIVAEELDVENDYKLENQSYVFNTFLRSVPAIYQADALCTITGI